MIPSLRLNGWLWNLTLAAQQNHKNNEDRTRLKREYGKQSIYSKVENKTVTFLHVTFLSWRCRHWSIALFFGDEKPACDRACDVCRNPKKVELELLNLQSGKYGTMRTGVKGGAMMCVDDDMYGGGRKGVKRWEYLFVMVLIILIIIRRRRRRRNFTSKRVSMPSHPHSAGIGAVYYLASLSHYCQTWHGDCLRHEKASHLNYIDLDLHSRSQILIMKTINVWLFQKRFKQCHQVCH